jgi:glycosyltransferase involved in cell wall biosynthesis
MRILYLAELLTDGGTAKHLAEILPRLRQAGIDPVVWSRGAQGRYARRLVDSGIALEVRPGIDLPLLTPSRTAGVRLVHSYLYGPHLSDALICRARRIPYLMSTRNTGHWFTDRAAVRLRVALRTPLVRHHLANSTGVARYLAAYEGVRPERITVIPNGMVDRHAEEPMITRPDLALGETDFVLLSVAWLKPRKSIDFLIRGLAALLPSVPRLRLVLAGDGPDEDRLKALAAELGVAEACRFLGRHPAPHAIARLADVAVSASDEEGMSNSSIEALMMGVPVVACAETAGNDDIVADGVNGYLYPHNDQGAFLSRIARLCADSALLESMRAAARRTFEEKFTMDAQVRAFLDVYRRIAA